MDRIILHSDINACYANIELLFDPTLCGKPVAVAGDAERRHGIVLSKTEEAKRCGVKTAMTIWEAKRACPELVVVPPHFGRYTQFSREVRKIYLRYTDRHEPFGLDESWLDLTGCLGVSDGTAAAMEIKERIKCELGLTVSIGVSWNKVFAKLGSDYKKPDAVTAVTRENYRDLLWPLPVSDLLFVGRRSAEALGTFGIRTIGDLARADEAMLKKRFGRMGERLHVFANGLDDDPVLREGEGPPAKSIGNGTTTPRDMHGLNDAMPVLVSLAESVGARLRRAGMLAGTLTLELRSTDLSWRSRRTKLAFHTDSDREIIDTALRLLGEAHAWPEPLRGMGIRAEELEAVGLPEQIDILIDYVNKNEQRGLDRAVDNIRARYGDTALRRGAVFAQPDMSVPAAQEDYAFVRKVQDAP